MRIIGRKTINAGKIKKIVDKYMEDWIKKNKDNIVLIGINKDPILISRKLIQEDNALNIILKCVYTSVKHQLSFKQTIKQDSYFLLDNIINTKVGVIKINDILGNEQQVFKFKKDTKIFGIPRLLVMNNPIINSKIHEKYSKSQYKEAFDKRFDNIFSLIAFYIFGKKIFGYKKELKYSIYWYGYINSYLSGINFSRFNDINEKTKENILKIIDVMDEMFMVAPLSEDNMILYRGYDQYDYKNEKEGNIKDIKFGIEPRYISTTIHKDIAYVFSLPYSDLKIEQYDCCFTVLHLDDGIPYIDISNMSFYPEEGEILLPRGVKTKYLYSENDYKIDKNVSIIAHHIQISLTPKLKKLYHKKEKCIQYQTYKIDNQI